MVGGERGPSVSVAAGDVFVVAVAGGVNNSVYGAIVSTGGEFTPGVMITLQVALNPCAPTALTFTVVATEVLVALMVNY
jgi:uncharacterized protein YjlB